MDGLKVIYREADPGTRCFPCRWIDVEHQQRRLGTGPLTPARVRVRAGIRAVGLELANIQPDQVAVEAPRAFDIGDQKLDLHEARGHSYVLL